MIEIPRANEETSNIVKALRESLPVLPNFSKPGHSYLMSTCGAQLSHIGIFFSLSVGKESLHTDVENESEESE
ncbi:MAG: hypothetical protein NPIRA01_00500 [Nitrospirales bacterium]|nr:MAG: hypothetical protein NPIRA01_00500 [Nitrospirales bacterium]